MKPITLAVKNNDILEYFYGDNDDNWKLIPSVLASLLNKEEYINLFPTNGEWKKTYLVLTDVVSIQTAATEFEIYLEVQKDRSSQPLVLIDNLKVMF